MDKRDISNTRDPTIELQSNINANSTDAVDKTANAEEPREASAVNTTEEPHETTASDAAQEPPETKFVNAAEELREASSSLAVPREARSSIVESTNAYSGTHLIAGPGGSRAILAASGMIMALFHFGIKRYATIGGVSGGSLPLRLLAHGLNARELIEIAIELKFDSLLDEEESFTTVMVEHYRSSRYKGELPTKGQYKSHRLGAWVDSFSNGVWPDNFWTLAVEKKAQVLLTREGVFKRQEGEKFTRISSVTPPLGLSIQASCTVPGLFTPIEFALSDTGQKLVLYDGGLSWEGKRPMTIAEEHFLAQPSDIIMCDVGPDVSAYDRIMGTIWKLVCGGRCISPLGKRSENENKALLILPVVTSLSSFDFDAHPDRKWEAIMEGFAASVYSLNKGYRLTEEQFLEAKDVIAVFNGLVTSCKKSPGDLSAKTAKLLSDRGLL